MRSGGSAGKYFSFTTQIYHNDKNNLRRGLLWRSRKGFFCCAPFPEGVLNLLSLPRGMRGEGVPHDCVDFRVLGRSRVTTHYLPGIGVFRQHELLRILREHSPTQGQHRTEPGPVWLKLVCGLDAQELLYLDVRLLHSNIFCPTFFDKISNRLRKKRGMLENKSERERGSS